MTHPNTPARLPRRTFMLHLAATGSLVTAGADALAQAKVDEADEGAVALGYKHDTTKADSKKYPQHKPEQKCHNCQFWQGTQADAWAGCAMFGRKQIAANGWCLAYKKVA